MQKYFSSGREIIQSFKENLQADLLASEMFENSEDLREIIEPEP
jgi:hypothetical protein